VGGGVLNSWPSYGCVDVDHVSWKPNLKTKSVVMIESYNMSMFHFKFKLASLRSLSKYKVQHCHWHQEMLYNPPKDFFSTLVPISLDSLILWLLSIRYDEASSTCTLGCILVHLCMCERHYWPVYFLNDKPMLCNLSVFPSATMETSTWAYSTLYIYNYFMYIHFILNKSISKTNLNHLINKIHSISFNTNCTKNNH